VKCIFCGCGKRHRTPIDWQGKVMPIATICDGCGVFTVKVRPEWLDKRAQRYTRVNTRYGAKSVGRAILDAFPFVTEVVYNQGQHLGGYFIFVGEFPYFIRGDRKTVLAALGLEDRAPGRGLKRAQRIADKARRIADEQRGAAEVG
jgi:hypothetical protein